MLEGEHLVAVYAQRHGAPETLIVTDDALARPARARAGRAPRRARTLVVPRALFAELAALPAERRRARRRRRRRGPRPRRRADFCLLLDDVQDPGNVGSMLRSAAAAGVAQVLLSKHCAFAWSPKVLRAGQGAHFCVDIHEDVDLPAWARGVSRDGGERRRHGRRGRRRACSRRALGGRVAIAIGNEGAGLSAGARRAGDAAGDDSDAGRHRIAQRRGGGGRLPVRMRAAAGAARPADVRDAR